MEQILDENSAQLNQSLMDRDLSFAARWKHGELFNQGYVPVPSQFLFHYANLKPHSLSAGEAMFVLHLMSFKWGAENPFPGYARLAKRMGVTEKMVRRYAKSLEEKKYLVRQPREGKSNSYDLTLLFDALKKSMFRQPDIPGEEMMQ